MTLYKRIKEAHALWVFGSLRACVRACVCVCVCVFSGFTYDQHGTSDTKMYSLVLAAEYRDKTRTFNTEIKFYSGPSWILGSEKSRILLKPVLGGVGIVTLSISSYEQFK